VLQVQLAQEEMMRAIRRNRIRGLAAALALVSCECPDKNPCHEDGSCDDAAEGTAEATDTSPEDTGSTGTESTTAGDGDGDGDGDDDGDGDGDGGCGPNPPPQTDDACPGKDLWIDRFNCGECGHFCTFGPATGEWPETGGCECGSCLPDWSACFNDADNVQSCAEVCQAESRACAPQGCGGYTALFFPEGGEFNQCANAFDKLTLGCDEPLPWDPENQGWPQTVLCCCEQD
jgi:hypothetical protein